jgi:hypothetical protein
MHCTDIILFIIIVLVVILFMSLFSNNNNKERFTATQRMETPYPNANGVDPAASNEQTWTPPEKTNKKNYESLIFDSTTGAIMTGTDFMENTGLVAPPWVAPAWDPSAFGPSSQEQVEATDYENDSRMIYNKCSPSCCSPQYPTAFQGDVDPFVCDENGNNKYLSSDYMCTNNTGNSGCLCMSPKQVEGMRSGWTNYYVNKEHLGY